MKGRKPKQTKWHPNPEKIEFFSMGFFSGFYRTGDSKA
jgi:hypothetical protein